MGIRKGSPVRSTVALAAVATALVIPASASAGDVTVTASPTSLPAPGGNFTFTVNVAKIPASGSFVDDNSVLTLTDSVYGNLNGKGTCVTPSPLPYSCSFTGAFNGAAGAIQTNTVNAFQLAIINTGMGPSPENYARTGSATVSLTSPVVQNPPKKKCKKGFVLKKVKTKNGVKKKCVKKKKR
jgi:hypothetical protein